MIDAVALRSLVYLETHGTIGATAAALGYTPSAVSQQINRLEADLGVSLTERVGRGIVLTPRGRAAVERARAVLEGYDALRAQMDASHEVRGSIRMAAFATAVRGIVAPLVRRLRAQAPDLRLEVVEEDPPFSAESLARGEVDIAVLHGWVGMPLRVPTEVATERLTEDRADLMVPADHPLAVRCGDHGDSKPGGRPRVTPAELVGETWVSTPVDTVCHQWLLQMFAGAERGPQIHYWASEFASHVAYVQAGAAVALIPRLGLTSIPDGVAVLDVYDPVPRRPVLVAWRRSTSHDPAVGLVRRVLLDAAGRQDPRTG